jgi:hypothetical protein
VVRAVGGRETTAAGRFLAGAMVGERAGSGRVEPAAAQHASSGLRSVSHRQAEAASPLHCGQGCGTPGQHGRRSRGSQPAALRARQATGLQAGLHTGVRHASARARTHPAVVFADDHAEDGVAAVAVERLQGREPEEGSVSSVFARTTASGAGADQVIGLRLLATRCAAAVATIRRLDVAIRHPSRRSRRGERKLTGSAQAATGHAATATLHSCCCAVARSTGDAPPATAQ